MTESAESKSSFGSRLKAGSVWGRVILNGYYNSPSKKFTRPEIGSGHGAGMGKRETHPGVCEMQCPSSALVWDTGN